MAEGNDSVQAERDLQAAYGKHPNARDLIALARARADSDVERVARSRVNTAATAALDLKRIEPEHGGTVISATVRGEHILYAAEGRDGRVYKGVAPYVPEGPEGW